ncbi:MAG: hypothetical protein JWP47_1643 [Polaromonas sp.]|jgi:LPS-assembly lipoprotein|nr:hypothetical protein [Polaromonas sp.]
MQRRFFLSSVTATALVYGLVGCGFALRKAPDFAFTTLYSPLGEGSQLGVQLKRQLESSGKVRVVNSLQALDATGAVLDVLADHRERVVVGYNSSGQVRELQLRMRFRFKLRTPQGKELIPESEISLSRDLSYNESNAVAKEAEEALLYRDMQNDIVQQLLRRLGAVDTL